MAKEISTIGALVVFVWVVASLTTLVQPAMANDDYNSPIWDGWVDEDRSSDLRPCLDIIKSAECQVELYNYYFNISKKELDLSCCIFVKAMGKKCALRFLGWYLYPGLEAYRPNPMKAYNNCVRRLDAPPPMSF